MDTGNGEFKYFETLEELEKAKPEFQDHGGTFRVGEEIEIRGSRFRIKSIKPKEIRLKLLSRTN